MRTGRGQTDPNAGIPGHVLLGMKIELNFTDPVLGLREGTWVRKGKIAQRICLEPDHRLARKHGGLTTPENIRLISNIANRFKSDAKLTDENIRERFVESGLAPFDVPKEHAAVLEQYGIKKIEVS
jgi:hypothetical protein